METYFEIIQDKTYRQLTPEQKDAIQARQTALVIQWQDATNELEKELIFDELFASLNGLIKGMAYRRANNSFSVEQEDFEGIMYLTLVETLAGVPEGQIEMYGQKLLKFDRTLNKPFQPIFLTNIKYVLKMMYRQKGYDVHDDTLNTHSRLDSPSPDDATVTMGDALEVGQDLMANIEMAVLADELLTELFGQDDRKKTIVHMMIQDFKRSEIVSAVISEGKSKDATARLVNRTWTDFKNHYIKLTELKLV